MAFRMSLLKSVTFNWLLINTESSHQTYRLFNSYQGSKNICLFVYLRLQTLGLNDVVSFTSIFEMEIFKVSLPTIYWRFFYKRFLYYYWIRQYYINVLEKPYRLETMLTQLLLGILLKCFKLVIHVQSNEHNDCMKRSNDNKTQLKI